MNNSYPFGPKSGWLEQAKKIADGEIRMNPSDIPMLIGWLKDMNWPGAEIIAEYLPSFGFALIRYVGDALKSRDAIWIYWILVALKDAFDEKFWLPLKADLENIGFQWNPENAHIESLYILARYKLVEQERLRSVISAIKVLPEADPDDYVEIEKLLNK